MPKNMKLFQKIIVIVFALHFLVGCQSTKEPEQKYDGTRPGPVIIAGKIRNPPESLNEIIVNVDDFALAKILEFKVKVDFSDSTFHIEFERYLPEDMFIVYGNLTIDFFAGPGDSIFIEFNAEGFDEVYLDKRLQLFESLKFSGDNAEFNRLMSIYHKETIKNRKYWNWIFELEKRSTPGEIKKVRDSLRNSEEQYLVEFEKKYHPDKTLIELLRFDIRARYVRKLTSYPTTYAYGKDTNFLQVVPLSFYSFYESPLPEIALISSKTYSYVSGYTRYISTCIFQKMIDDSIAHFTKEYYIRYPKGVDFDSLEINYAVKNTKDSLLLKLTLCSYFAPMIRNMDFSSFEKYKPYFDKYITEPFLREPLLDLYKQKKEAYIASAYSFGPVMNNTRDITGDSLVKELLSTCSGKVIYLDCWATYCTPCVSHLHTINDMMKKFNKDDVSFAFFCFDTDTAQWRDIIESQKIKGIQYILNKQQSKYLKELWGIKTFSHYVIFDRNGDIAENSSDLWPNKNSTSLKIDSLIHK